PPSTPRRWREPPGCGAAVAPPATPRLLAPRLPTPRLLPTRLLAPRQVGPQQVAPRQRAVQAQPWEPRSCACELVSALACGVMVWLTCARKRTRPTSNRTYVLSVGSIRA